MIGSAKVLTISTQKWTFWVNSLTYLCCAERGQIYSDCLQILNLCRGAPRSDQFFFQKSFFFLEKNIFEKVRIWIFFRFSKFQIFRFFQIFFKNVWSDFQIFRFSDFQKFDFSDFQIFFEKSQIFYFIYYNLLLSFF